MTLFLTGAIALTAMASIFDLRNGHIPNWLTLGGLAVALFAHVMAGFARGGWTGAAAGGIAALAGAILCAIVPATVFALGGIGGGDVKLFAAVGAFCLVLHGLQAEWWSFVVGLIVAPGYLAYQGSLVRTLRQTVLLVVRPFRRGLRAGAAAHGPPEPMTWLRFAPAIFAGTLLMTTLYGGR